MKRLVAASTASLWMAAYAGLSVLALLAAEHGVPAALAWFRLPAAAGMIDFASRPMLGGFCLGAAIVAALFATVVVSSVLNPREHLRQGALIGDMAFGGAFGLMGITTLAALFFGALPLLAASLPALAVLGAGFAAMRWAMRPDAAEAPTPLAVRRMAVNAAADANVVAFPLRARAAMGGTR